MTKYGTITTGTLLPENMSQLYFAQRSANNLAKKKLTLALKKKKFWLSVYTAEQNYRWLIFLAVPVVISYCPHTLLCDAEFRVGRRTE